MGTPAKVRTAQHDASVVPIRAGAGRTANLDPGATHWLFKVLRNPLAPFLKTLAAELKAPDAGNLKSIRRLIAEDPCALLVLRVAVETSAGWQHLLTFITWRLYLTKNEELGLSKATARYVATLRRSGVKISQSSLYEYADRFKTHGLAGLIPQYAGGRSLRIPAADRTLINRLSALKNSYGLYALVRKHYGLPDRPVSRHAYQVAVEEGSKAKRASTKRGWRGKRPRTSEPSQGLKVVSDLRLEGQQ